MTSDRTVALAERALNDARLCRREAQAIVDDAAANGWTPRYDSSPADLVRVVAGRGLRCLDVLAADSARDALRRRHPDIDDLVSDLDDQLRALALTAEANAH